MQSLLYMQLQEGTRTGVVDQLLSHDPRQLEWSRSNGKNALHMAARQGHVDVVKLLLGKDPQLARRTDKKGQTALHMAVKGVSCEVVKLILGADAAILSCCQISLAILR